MTTHDGYDVCIVGAGIAGSLLAHALTRAGQKVILVEAGRRWNFAERITQLRDHQVLGRPRWDWVVDGRDDFVDVSERTAGFSYPLNLMRMKGVGGSSLHWDGRINRLQPSDFKVASTYGMGHDWPIAFEDLEPHYSDADWLIGVSGAEDAAAPPRSRPYPMPGFPPGFDDRHWLSVAAARGLALRTSAFAIASQPYEGRSHCLAYASCGVCPSGARYSSDRHVDAALATGRCTLLTDTTVRRIEVDRSGRTTAVHGATADGDEVSVVAKRYVVAAHAVESARLLLLSGVGNRSGQVGRNFMEHPYIISTGYVPTLELYPFRIGFSRLESIGYYDGHERRERGAIKLEFSYQIDPLIAGKNLEMWGGELRDHDLEQFGRGLMIEAETEQQPNPDSRVRLDPEKRDRFGDPIPRIEFAFSEVDRRTQARAREIVTELLQAAGAVSVTHRDLMFGAHHMGTCRMSHDPDHGVVDADLRVHGTENLFVLGSSVFPTSGAMQPTSTIAALSLRLAKHLLAGAVV